MSTSEQQVITAAEVQQAQTERVSLLATFAQRYGLEANNMMRTLRSTVLRPNKEGREPTNEQVAAFLIVANQHNLSPFTKEIHGFLDKWGGIVAVVGLDGWAKKINDHPAFDGMEFEQDDEKCTCTIYRKDRSHPTSVTEYLIECRRTTDPWASHPKRMLRHKAMIQCARIAFSFAGIYDPDEAENIVAASEVDVTPELTPEQVKAGKIAPKKLRELVDGMLAAEKANDEAALLALWKPLTNEQRLFLWGELRSWERTGLRKMLDAAEAKDCGIQLDKLSESNLRACKTLDALADAMAKVTDAYAENEQEVPGDIQSLYQELRAELKAQ